jgi:hypothetical protein
MKKTKPDWQDPKWVYVPSVATNVLARFKTLGWKPPSEKSRNH